MAADRNVCPDCAGPVRADRDRLCPRCGYPLMFLEAEPAPDAAPIGRKPGERDDATAVLAAPEERTAANAQDTVPDRPLAAGEVRCARCGRPNPLARSRCERCGQELRPAPPAPVPPSAPPTPARRPAVPVRVIGVGVVALLAVAVAAGFLIRHWSRPAPGDQAGTAKASMARVAPGSVRASASSSIPHDPRYAVSKTLDGDPATAWNSNGARIPSNVGVRLTYTFDRPVRLARITVINGYAHTPTDYRNNQRVKRCTVLTDAGSRDWSLADTAAPQRLDADLGPTGAVTLVVKEVYPGTVYPDLAVSEVSFDERR